MAQRIQESEVTAAVKLAQRKKGATRTDLAAKLGVSVGRAKQIFAKAGLKSVRKGGSGKDNRAMIYTTKVKPVKKKGTVKKKKRTRAKAA